MNTQGFYQVKGKVQEFLKKLAVGLILVGIGSVITLGTGTYVWLKTDNARLDAELIECHNGQSAQAVSLEEAQADLNLGL